MSALALVFGEHLERHAVLLLAHHLVDGLGEPLEVLAAVALRELQHGVVAHGVALLVHPGEGLGGNVVGPEPHVAGLEHEREAHVLFLQLARHPLLLDVVEEEVEERDECQHGHGARQFPYPRGYARILSLWVEPLVLDGCEHLLGEQLCIDAVNLREQSPVVRHELVFAVRNVDGCQLEVVGLVFLYEPLERHRVPHNLAVWVGVGPLYGVLHVLVALGVGFPSPFYHQMVAEASLVYDDMLAAQVFHGLYLRLHALLVSHAVSEEVQDRRAVGAELVVEFGVHTHHQVRLAVPQVCQGLAGGFELDDEGYVEPLADEPEQVDVIAHRLAVGIEEGVWPQVPGVLIDQRVFGGEGGGAVGGIIGLSR